MTFLRRGDFIFIGRGINYPIALEGALKLKEISYIHAEGYPAGEMKHGPIALLDEKVPVVAIATKGTVYEKVLSNAQEAKARDARLIGVVPMKRRRRRRKPFDALLPVPNVDELLSPVLTVVPGTATLLSHCRPPRPRRRPASESSKVCHCRIVLSALRRRRS